MRAIVTEIGQVLADDYNYDRCIAVSEALEGAASIPADAEAFDACTLDQAIANALDIFTS